ncbi:unnamed protein product [Ectocarpus sp. CCAP 1310/34]|nr:unnamed protein product [Ectocarpus sp. CCAP 1310/34]
MNLSAPYSAAACQEWYFLPPRQLLEAAHDEQHVDGGSPGSKSALFLREDVVGFAEGA